MYNRNLKKNVKNIGGKEKLTNNMIDRLQNYYGIAIRSNKGDLQSIAVYASYLHVASSSKNNWHDHCPDGPKSWCMYKKDTATGEPKYKSGPDLALNVICVIKPIFVSIATVYSLFQKYCKTICFTLIDVILLLSKFN